MHVVDPAAPRSMPAAASPGGEARQSAPVVVYFGDTLLRLYQLRQWLPVLEILDALHPVLLVTREDDAFAALQPLTVLPSVLLPTFADLSEFYRTGHHQVVVYVNNSARNFPSLAARDVLHVHVNHGESDKICMVSNQVKAYDRVFVAGQAAVDRHRAALLDADRLHLVTVGRPQLDLHPAPVLEPSPRRTVLYAPTWEGEEPRNNYTSLDVMGPHIVAAALAVPGARVVYKPHPRILDSTTPQVAGAHREILARIERAGRHDPDAGHVALPAADILAVIPSCDVMITDVSSVGLDYLYLRADRPLFIADRYSDRRRLLAEAPVSRCADVIDTATLPGLTATLAARLAHDELAPTRATAREHYFGTGAPGSSTRRFLAAIDDAIQDRDRLAARRAAHSPAVARHPAPYPVAERATPPAQSSPERTRAADLPVAAVSTAATTGTAAGGRP